MLLLDYFMTCSVVWRVYCYPAPRVATTPRNWEIWRWLKSQPNTKSHPVNKCSLAKLENFKSSNWINFFYWKKIVWNLSSVFCPKDGHGKYPLARVNKFNGSDRLKIWPLVKYRNSMKKHADSFAGEIYISVPTKSLWALSPLTAPQTIPSQTFCLCRVWRFCVKNQ